MQKNIKVPEHVCEILNTLNNNGHEAYVVGGCVRDGLMGNAPHDWDICSSALPTEVKEIFPNNFPLGEKFGTISVQPEGQDPVEITTYRTESNYEDGRRPTDVQFSMSLTEDLSRRDFTINAIAYNPNIGFVDPYGGVQDIENKSIRAVGNPNERFQEDGLRILRAVRFSSKLGFDIEDNTKQAMKENLNMLDCVANERKGVEFSKILVTDNVRSAIMDNNEVISYFIPEFKVMMETNQTLPYHLYNVAEHTLRAVEHMPPQEDLRLAAFFHDIGKPNVALMKDDRMTFNGHPKESVEIAKNVMQDLRYSTDTINKVCLLVETHDMLWDPTKTQVKKLMNKLGGEEMLNSWMELRSADKAAQAPQNDTSVEQIKAFRDQILEENAAVKISDLEVNGRDILNHLETEASPKLGLTLNMLLNKVVSEEIPNERNALLSEAEKINVILEDVQLPKRMEHDKLEQICTAYGEGFENIECLLAVTDDGKNFVLTVDEMETLRIAYKEGLVEEVNEISKDILNKQTEKDDFLEL